MFANSHTKAYFYKIKLIPEFDNIVCRVYVGVGGAPYLNYNDLR